MDWLLSLDLPTLGHLFAQTPAPSLLSSSNASEVEILKSQLEFMKWMNTAFLGFLGFLGALLTWFFNKSLEDARRLAKEIVRQELMGHLSEVVKAESENLMRTLQTERVIGETVVDYYVPDSDEEPNEYRLLKGRGFSQVRLWNNKRKINQRLAPVLVLDFVHSKVLELPGLNDPDKRNAAVEERDRVVEEIISEVIGLGRGREKPIFVIYTRPGPNRIGAIDRLSDTFPEIKYYSAANTPIALMGAVVDCAYVSYAESSLR